MKRILAAVAVAAFSASMAIAADDLMASRYDNTVVVKAADGKETKLHYNKDGTLAVTQPDGTKGTAKWVVKDGKLCITADAGPTAGKENCNPLAAHKVGDAWEQTLADGSKVAVSIVAGR